jgi:hypothetical protein
VLRDASVKKGMAVYLTTEPKVNAPRTTSWGQCRKQFCGQLACLKIIFALTPIEATLALTPAKIPPSVTLCLFFALYKFNLVIYTAVILNSNKWALWNKSKFNQFQL